jgi:hypothetical protein
MTMQVARALAWTALAIVAPALAATEPSVELGQTGSGRYAYVGRDSAAGRVVSYVHQGQFSYVRIETREPGAPPNQHPYVIDPAALRHVLLAVTTDTGKPEPILGPEALDEILGPLATALAQATPEQDVAFAVAARRGLFGPLSARVVTTGRVFRSAERLDVVIGLLHKDFENQFRATGYLIPFEPGKREKPVESATRIAVARGMGERRRADWAALRLDVLPPTPPPVAARPGAGGPAPAAPVTADALYKSVSERLKALQRLKDEGLITEQEYQDRRKVILQSL